MSVSSASPVSSVAPLVDSRPTLHAVPRPDAGDRQPTIGGSPDAAPSGGGPSATSPSRGGGAAASDAGSRRLAAVPDGLQPRGFALYVGLDEDAAREAGVDLAGLVAELRRVTAALAPSAETFAAVALAPVGTGGRDVDVVRSALGRPATPADGADRPTSIRDGVLLIDVSRRRVVTGEGPADLTYREFELLRFLVLREGRTVGRDEILGGVWSEGDDETPAARTIDVHVRRLRAKLGRHADIVRTVRGSGYRFDRHADVVVRFPTGPSPDRI